MHLHTRIARTNGVVQMEQWMIRRMKIEAEKCSRKERKRKITQRWRGVTGSEWLVGKREEIQKWRI